MRDYRYLDRAGLMRVLGEGEPIKESFAGWAIERTMMWLGIWGMGLVAVFIVAALAGLYFEMASAGWDFGRAALRWLLELPR